MPAADLSLPSPRSHRRLLLRGLRWLAVAAAALGLLAAIGLGCVWAPPPVGSVPAAQRLAAFPLRNLPLHAGVTVRWNAHAVPYILAEDERDVPFVMGLLHGHLRRTQIEVLRRLARGELAELAGGSAVAVDELLRALDIDRAVPEMVAALPPDSRAWLERFVAGLNLQSERQSARPKDAALLGLAIGQRWTIADVLSVARIAAVDVSLGRTLGLLSLSEQPRYGELRARLAEQDAAGTASFGPGTPTPLSALGQVTKGGSNSFAVAGARTASGAPLIANDPHLGFFLPNFWCLIGYRTPERSVVGMTLPGVPAVVIGRNRQIAFGGTNMTAYSSALVDVSGLDSGTFEVREEHVEVRLGRDRTLRLLETPHGPLISDLGLLGDRGLPPLALRWRGHEPSDEFTAFLASSHARDWNEFRAAFASYAVAGQNLLFASASGHIGQVLALEQIPAAAEAGATLIADPSDPRFAWNHGLRGTPSTRLPAGQDPDAGYLVSANNTPYRTDPPLSASGNSNDRVERIGALIEQHTPVTVDDAAAIQRDVYLTSGHDLCRRLVAAAPTDLGGSGQRFVALLREWDGHYSTDSRGALAYTRTLDVLLGGHYRASWGEPIERFLRGSPGLHEFIAADLGSGALPFSTVRDALLLAADAHDFEQTWGQVHRLPLQHPLANAPWIGGRWRFLDLPASGGSGTVQKSAGALTTQRHFAFFGAQSRHISDLSDLDANWFVLLGGQDGWIGSEHLIDQVELWEAGEMLQLPLRPATIERLFPTAQVLQRDPDWSE